MEEAVLKTKKKDLIETWRKLQTSDHFYYMCTKWSNDGDVHAYFSPYQSPYEAYIAFMNALSDLQLRVSYANTERENKERAKAGSERPVSVAEEIYNETNGETTAVKVEAGSIFERASKSSKENKQFSWWKSIIKKLSFFKSSR